MDADRGERAEAIISFSSEAVCGSAIGHDGFNESVDTRDFCGRGLRRRTVVTMAAGDAAASDRIATKRRRSSVSSRYRRLPHLGRRKRASLLNECIASLSNCQLSLPPDDRNWKLETATFPIERIFVHLVFTINS